MRRGDEIRDYDGEPIDVTVHVRTSAYVKIAPNEGDTRSVALPPGGHTYKQISKVDCNRGWTMIAQHSGDTWWFPNHCVIRISKA